LKPKNLGAHLNSLFDPDDFFLFCQKTGNVTDNEAYCTWNMGQGMIIVTPEPEKVIAIAESFGIEAQEVGSVTAEPHIVLTSRGAEKKGTTLTF
jgi:phosphoribosylformylglycinamidine cyclo-ligase